MATAPAVARMAQALQVVDDRTEILHERWCTPTVRATAEGDQMAGTVRDEIRVESFPYFAEDEKTGKSTKTHVITRCMECGASFAREV